MQAEIQAHARFFDRLADLVPAKYFLESEERLHLKSMKKNARAEAKRKLKEDYKTNKRLRLDPDAAQTTTEVQRQKVEDGHAAEDASAANGVADAMPGLRLTPSSGREELEQKLRSKIEAMRSKRKAEERQQSAQEAKQWREQSQKERLQRKQKQKSKQTQPPAEKQTTHATTADGKQQQQQNGTHNDAEDGFAFSNVAFQQGAHEGRGKKRKASKQQLLQQAESKQQRLAHLQQSADGEDALKKEAWKKAQLLASGAKVKDDPKLLKKSMKRDEKTRAKKAQAWKERNQKQQDQQQQKQQRRTENIQQRSDQKKKKKIEKREKKLMRAGFEGRTQKKLTSD